jgi:threonine/homoserine/homoserine lactone efflux protein
MPINWPDLAVFMMAALMLNLTPGNDMMFVLGQGIKGGAKNGIAASLGIATGSLVHLILVALGVAVILSQTPALFEAIRWAGAAYLVWLAVKTLTTPMGAFAAMGKKLSLLAAWRDGTLVNLLNPKVIIFMFAFLPPFVRPENGSPLLQLLILGMIFNIGGTLINFAVATSAATLRERLLANKTLQRVMSAVTATIFFGLALRLVMEKR